MIVFHKSFLHNYLLWHSYIFAIIAARDIAIEKILPHGFFHNAINRIVPRADSTEETIDALENSKSKFIM